MINTTAKLLILSILWYSKSTSLPKLYSPDYYFKWFTSVIQI